MTHWTDAADLLDERSDERQGFVSRFVPGVLAFTLSAALGVYLVYLRPGTQMPAPAPNLALKSDLALKSNTDVFGGLAPVIPPPSVARSAKTVVDPYGQLVLQGFGSSDRFAIAENPIPVPPIPPDDLRPSDEGAPLPPRRPDALARSHEPEPSAPVVARTEPRHAAPEAAAQPPGLFAKLFGGSTAARTPPETRLAYAAPPPSSGVSSALAARNGGLGAPGGGFGGFLRGLTFGSSPTSRFGDRVAVYDISAHVVYLPDGTRLEAHSGLGEARDDPNRVNERMRGPTPPATYALTPRGGSFHGVDALRLTPIDGNIYGRAGLLAHSFMLGPNGDSNGCVSFRDYEAFLSAYRNGQINKLVVVTRL